MGIKGKRRTPALFIYSPVVGGFLAEFLMRFSSYFNRNLVYISVKNALEIKGLNCLKVKLIKDDTLGDQSGIF